MTGKASTNNLFEMLLRTKLYRKRPRQKQGTFRQIFHISRVGLHRYRFCILQNFYILKNFVSPNSGFSTDLAKRQPCTNKQMQVSPLRRIIFSLNHFWVKFTEKNGRKPKKSPQFFSAAVWRRLNYSFHSWISSRDSDASADVFTSGSMFLTF